MFDLLNIISVYPSVFVCLSLSLFLFLYRSPLHSLHFLSSCTRRVNEEMSVMQLAALVARDSAITGSFTLAAGFPPKVLKNGSRGKSVKDAGLCGEAFVMANA